MKKLIVPAFCICALGARADVQPIAPDILSVHCGGNPDRTIIVTATNGADGSMTGREYETTRCQLSGRGGGQRLYAACANVHWDASGNVLGIELVTPTPAKAVCLS